MSERSYSDEHGCRNSGMPLGGIGAGSVEIRPDGYFYRWHVMNNRPWGAGSATDAMERAGLRFGARFDLGDGPRCLALGKHHGLDPGLDGWFWFSDPYHLPWVEHARDIEYTARIPFADLVYEFEEMPLQISLRAWSPFIPQQAADSNTPGAVLTFRVTNPTKQTCEFALFGLLKNAVGYDHPDLPSEITLIDAPDAGLLFTRGGLDSADTTQGTLALVAASAEETDVSWAIHPRHGRDLWDPLLKTGRLENVDYAGVQTGPIGEIGAEKTPGPKGMQRAALCLEATIEPGETAEFTFFLTWHFPNFRELDRRDCPGTLIGVQYANRFADAVEVARWLIAESPRLQRDAALFHDALYQSSLPDWELNAISASLSVLYRAAWWDQAGRFGIWEGLGCCGIQTIDVGHYASFPALLFFPELDASQNRLSAANLEPNGKVPHTMPGTFRCSDYGGGRGRIDLGAQYALAVWRHARWTGDLREAERLWPVVEGNLAWLAATDTDGDGLPNNQGPDQTYDRFPLYGTSAFVGFLYLAALRAGADLAGWLGKDEQAAQYREMATRAHAELERQLWNGKYYDLSHDQAAGTTNTGCMTDQVNGDWFFRQSSGEGLLDDGHVRSALQAVFAHNRRTAGPHGWLANCTWPQGGGIEITRRGSDQANCPWSGVEYAVAAHMVALGEREMGREAAWGVFERYENAGMRFNHLECGEFYHRWMSAWTMYLAEFGVAYDAFARRLYVSPPEGEATFLIVVPSGYAQAYWHEAAGELRLNLLHGTLALSSLRVRGKDVPVVPQTLQAGDEAIIRVE